jgi:excisionase family DNA binding protein
MSVREIRQESISSSAEEGLVDIAEAARILSVSVSTLYGWVWQRRIAFVKLGRAVRFEPTVLKEFIQNNRVEARRIFKT